MTHRYPISFAAACLGLLSLPACGDDSSSVQTATETLSAGSTGATQPSSADPTGDPSGDPTEGPGPDTEDPTDGPQAGPHALGTIFLGESHPAVGGDTTPAVTASFIPDADFGASKACSESVAGCQVALLPECKGGCDDDEYCSFDDACEPTCQRICDAPCGNGEVCYFPAADTPGCKPLESFDAGALTFFGTPLPITLFPPYAFMNDAKSSPFASAGTASVQASGAANAGFAAFDKEFTGTEFLQMNPKLDTIGFAEAFGDGPLPVRWIPGDDEVTITANVTTTTFATGTVTCAVDDASGSFDLPRAALDAALRGEEMGMLAVAVQRQRVDVYTDLATKGELSDVAVQPVGHLRIVTSSTEYHAFQCDPGETRCDDTCADLQSDHDNCGGCGKACGPDDLCDAGACTGSDACDACLDAAATGTCKRPIDDCASESGCKALVDCLDACSDDACIDTCFDQAAPGAEGLYMNQVSCLCQDACPGECVDFC